jgi:MFS family permease
MTFASDAQSEIDSPAAWWRLACVVAVAIIGSVSMFAMSVALPFVQADFGISRAAAALPYTLTMLGFAIGGIATGWVCDKIGIAAAVALGTLAFGLGFIGASFVSSPTAFALIHFIIGAGGSASFGPLMADISRWFVRHRGIAVGITAAGNYVGGMLWPLVLQRAMASEGWRSSYLAVGIVSAVLMLAFIFALRQRTPFLSNTPETATAATNFAGNINISSNALTILLCIAGVSCCVAMAMPQVHIVAYCGDLGFGPARGAEVLSTMLGFGLVSRIAWGSVADRLGGAVTLLIGTVLQGIALCLYLLFNGLVSLYVVSALYGLFQGGIVPMYAIIVRQYFPPKEAGFRVGIVLMSSLLGMALGAWMAGTIFDHTGSYRAAFINGFAWNAVNVGIMLWLVFGRLRRPPQARQKIKFLGSAG